MNIVQDIDDDEKLCQKQFLSYALKLELSFTLVSETIAAPWTVKNQGTETADLSGNP